MPNPLIRKLEAAGLLTDADKAILEGLGARSRRVEADQDLTVAGDRPEDVHLVLDGFAVRYKVVGDGDRQILAVFVPGDFCDLHVAILGEMDHSIATCTPCTIVAIPRATILDLTADSPRIAHALWWATLVDEGVLREWLVNMGQRETPQRLAHFFCEMLVRLQTVGRAEADGYDMPLTQEELGDILGVTTVHVNRSLQDLREAGLITLAKRRLTISDVDRLKAFCDFNPAYLHLTPRSPQARV